MTEMDFNDNGVAWVENDKLRVVREDEPCRNCGSHVTYHPDHITPSHLIQCYNCQFTRGRRYWDKKITDYTEGNA